MITAISRGGNIASALAVTSQPIPSLLRPIIAPVVGKSTDIIRDKAPVPQLGNSMSKLLPKGGLRLGQCLTSSMNASAQVRYAHTDLAVPDFDMYRREQSKDQREARAGRKTFTYVLMGGLGSIGLYSGKNIVSDVVSTMSASADVLALAKIEVKLSDVPEGKSAVFKWRGKPLFIRHRTMEEVDRERAVDIETLRDQQRDEDRVKKDAWLILLGVCTHLGCVPIANAGDFGGYYCPCHGSHYDASGRIRKGPAPLNLEVPIYEYTDDDTVVVG